MCFECFELLADTVTSVGGAVGWPGSAAGWLYLLVCALAQACALLEVVASVPWVTSALRQIHCCIGHERVGWLT